VASITMALAEREALALCDTSHRSRDLLGKMSVIGFQPFIVLEWAWALSLRSAPN
jgi:hypothetical protein